ncbi:MAG TPA: hypothetical protein VFW40_10425, partial [Capsulimonadaceae bacterium]|nr:hypothetical protein [Capsulimonadaceae bacterium]
MLSETPSQIAIWTDEGRNDNAAEVGLIAAENGAIRVEIEAASAALTCAALQWSMPIPPGALILSDHWERGYGDLEWRGIV